MNRACLDSRLVHFWIGTTSKGLTPLTPARAMLSLQMKGCKQKMKRMLLPQKIDDWTPLANIEDAAIEIRNLNRNLHANGYLIGRHLLCVKKQLGSGKFRAWVEEKVGYSQRKVSHLMAHAHRCLRAGEVLEYHPGIPQMATIAKLKLKLEEAMSSIARIERTINSEMNKTSPAERYSLALQIHDLALRIVEENEKYLAKNNEAVA